MVYQILSRTWTQWLFSSCLSHTHACLGQKAHLSCKLLLSVRSLPTRRLRWFCVWTEQFVHASTSCACSCSKSPCWRLDWPNVWWQFWECSHRLQTWNPSREHHESIPIKLFSATVRAQSPLLLSISFQRALRDSLVPKTWVMLDAARSGNFTFFSHNPLHGLACFFRLV